MSIPFAHQTVTILSDTDTTDEYGNPRRDWSNPSSVVVPRCHVQPVDTSEELGARERDQVVSRYRVWLPAGTAITANDRIEWGPLLLSVDGEPKRWPSPDGGEDHVEVITVVSAG